MADFREIDDSVECHIEQVKSHCSFYSLYQYKYLKVIICALRLILMKMISAATSRVCLDSLLDMYVCNNQNINITEYEISGL